MLTDSLDRFQQFFHLYRQKWSAHTFDGLLVMIRYFSFVRCPCSSLLWQRHINLCMYNNNNNNNNTQHKIYHLTLIAFPHSATALSVSKCILWKLALLHLFSREEKRKCHCNTLLFFIARQHAMHAERDIVLANPSVRPSVCLSVTLWYDIKTNAQIVKLFPRSCRGITLVFSNATAVMKFQKELPQWGR